MYLLPNRLAKKNIVHTCDYGICNTIFLILIEHDMSLVMQICERMKVIDYGTTIAEGTPEEIQNNERVIKAYLGEA